MAKVTAEARLPVRPVKAILATTDVHSSLGDPLPMLSHLHKARPNTLVADCGDFFEGSGYYRLGGGALERRLLTRLYDVLAPGNHGWHHHLEPDLRPLTVCANVTDDAGAPLFRPLHWAEIGGQLVAVTAVLGEQAFACLPARDRAGLHFIEPARALHALAEAHRADAWIVLSHAGYQHDLALAQESPHLDVIFAGHCHSDHYGPTVVGATQVVKGYELAAGYATATPQGSGWHATVHRFAPANHVPLPLPLQALVQEIDHIRRRLQEPLAVLAPRFRNRPLDLPRLLSEVAAYLRHRACAEAVVLNQTSLRTLYLREYLTVGTLLGIEPFANQLTTVNLPDQFVDRPQELVAGLARWMGPIITAPDPLPARLRQVVTTQYVAMSFLDTANPPDGEPLADIVRHVLRTSRP
ncbi:metallophosphoesterase [Nonomuraea sp. NPDC052129]|uniref:metallophosphoesterase n=1 Tax=Nonomuraea sp. NPDC052129 TaxID=3154651 RepID=UPI0034310778